MHLPATSTLTGFLLGITCVAQQWCVPGATWHYSADPSIQGYTKYVYTGDTLLDGVTGNVIRYSSNDGPFINARYITRAENDVIYIYQDFPEWEISFWDTLIWFGAEPGDRWDNLTYIDHSCECPYTVVDTGHVEVDGVQLRTVDTEDLCCFGAQPRRFTERIGWDQDPFTCPISVACIPSLRCYSDNEISLETGIVPYCQMIVGLEEKFTPPSWSIIPEFDGHIRFQGLDPQRSQWIRLVDPSGRTALNIPLPPGDATINISSLANGSYVVQAFGNQALPPLLWMKY